MDETEEALIARCQGGDKEAFGILVKRYAGRAIGAAFSLLSNHADALDVSQEAFVRAWRSIRRFRGETEFYAWYSSILRNQCIDRLRRRSKSRTVELADHHPHPQSTADPELLAERNERIERIWKAILTLPMKHREVIVMNHFQQMSYKQIASMLGVPIGTVMSRLHNARQALRQRLAGDQL